MTPGTAVLLLVEAALGAFILLLVAMGAVALGAWAGFSVTWFLLFLLYVLAKLIVADPV